MHACTQSAHVVGGDQTAHAIAHHHGHVAALAEFETNRGHARCGVGHVLLEADAVVCFQELHRFALAGDQADRRCEGLACEPHKASVSSLAEGTRAVVRIAVGLSLHRQLGGRLVFAHNRGEVVVAAHANLPRFEVDGVVELQVRFNF